MEMDIWQAHVHWIDSGWCSANIELEIVGRIKNWTTGEVVEDWG
jgi:hypothetical protein